MELLLANLRIAYPHLEFATGKQFSWSPETHEIIYKIGTDDQRDRWSLLHETGHALLEHTSYQADYSLLRLEVAAWEKARELARQFAIVLDEDHVQDCLDTYRDWLYKRSICPSCASKCLQQDDYAHYRCYNCHAVWRVTPSRFCRSYRSSKIKKPSAVFHETDGIC
ncbi:MAG: hypothetical protein ABI602_00070 [Candidatus Saccharibacteria bacterium]